jgi:PKD repeat protein
MFTISNKLSTLKLMAILFIVFSCDDDKEEPIPAVVADFSYAVDATDKGKVTFTNTSENAVSVSWNFGDGSAAVTTTSPVYTYEESGTYQVTLTATGADAKVSTKTRAVVIEIPEEGLTEAKLMKSWKISADAGSFKVGPGVNDGSWWTLGATSERPCLANDLFIFKADGVFEYDAQGDVFGEPYMGIPDGCQDETALTGDQAAWASGEHEFTFTPAEGANPATITVTGTGAFIALPKAYNGGEYNATDNMGPDADASVTYNVLSYTEGDNERLTLSLPIASPGTWTFVLEPAQ